VPLANNILSHHLTNYLKEWTKTCWVRMVLVGRPERQRWWQWRKSSSRGGNTGGAGDPGDSDSSLPDPPLSALYIVILNPDIS